MKKNILICLTLCFSVASIAAQSLKEQLWDFANSCYTNFVDEDEDGKPESATIIDDSKNGYLSIDGTWPACGCGCNATVGAYTMPDGSYALLKNEEFTCTWDKGISSNRDLLSILPVDFGIRTFSDAYLPEIKDTAGIFYVWMEIPRKGTITKLHIDLVPLGLNNSGINGIAYTIGERDYSQMRHYYEFVSVITNLEGEKTLDQILAGDFNKIEKGDKDKLKDGISDSDFGLIKSMGDYTEHLQYFNTRYHFFNGLTYKTLIMDWDVKKGRFFIKEKVPVKERIDFKTFLKTCPWWTPIC